MEKSFDKNRKIFFTNFMQTNNNKTNALAGNLILPLLFYLREFRVLENFTLLRNPNK